MTKLLLPLFAFAALSLSSASQAAELSPWMGGEGQAPFQLDPVTMVAVTFAAGVLAVPPMPETLPQPRQ